jgi:hypothetical protein
MRSFLSPYPGALSEPQAIPATSLFQPVTDQVPLLTLAGAMGVASLMRAVAVEIGRHRRAAVRDGATIAE